MEYPEPKLIREHVDGACYDCGRGGGDCNEYAMQRAGYVRKVLLCANCRASVNRIGIKAETRSDPGLRVGRALMRPTMEGRTVNGTITQKDGYLVVQGEWGISDSAPVQERTFWPTGLRASEWPQFEGQPVKFIGGGQYRCQNGYIIELRDGANTTGCHYETKPIKKPKWAVSWRDGKWCRH